jgi:hypothetical protein
MRNSNYDAVNVAGEIGKWVEKLGADREMKNLDEHAWPLATAQLMRYSHCVCLS